MWKPEYIEQLKALHAEGLTFLAIANKLGTTRNAIAGLCRRQKLTRIDPLAPKKKKTKSPGSGKRPSRPTFSFGALTRTAPKPKTVVVKPVAIPEPEPLRIGLLDLTDKTCKWSVEDRPHLFCGIEVVPGKSWCPHHHGRVFNEID